MVYANIDRIREEISNKLFQIAYGTDKENKVEKYVIGYSGRNKTLTRDDAKEMIKHILLEIREDFDHQMDSFLYNEAMALKNAVERVDGYPPETEDN